MLEEFAPTQVEPERVIKTVDANKDGVFFMYDEIYKRVQVAA